MLHGDNAPSHRALERVRFSAVTAWSPILHTHTPYSLYFFLFPKMKLKLKGRRFNTLEEIQCESQKVLDTLGEQDFQNALRQWQRRWEDYFEGGGAQT